MAEGLIIDGATLLQALETVFPPKPPADPGLIIRHSVNLGEQDRILQFESFADRDAQLPEIDHLCDVMRQAGDRQRALHLLPSYRRNLEDVEHKQNENKKRLAELDAGLKAMDDARASKTLDLRRELGEKISAARDEHAATGRRQEFKPTAAVTSRVQAQIDQLAANQAKDHAEAQVQRSTLDNELKEGARAIFKWQQLIDEHEALARGAPANGG